MAVWLDGTKLKIKVSEEEGDIYDGHKNLFVMRTFEADNNFLICIQFIACI